MRGTDNWEPNLEPRAPPIRATSQRGQFQPLADRIREAIGELEADLQLGKTWIHMVTITAPLAGLLGTVGGMIETFDSMREMSLFTQSGGIAGGISQALFTTQMGLAVAIPGLLAGRGTESTKVLSGWNWSERKFCPAAGRKGGNPMKRMVPMEDAETAVDISPLIDMVFILLIFFMVTNTFVKDMKVDLLRPGAASASLASTQSIRILIDPAGQFFVDNLPVRVWMLQSRVRDLLQESPEAPVLVVTDQQVSAERLIEVIDQCRLAGAVDVGVATEKEAM